MTSWAWKAARMAMMEVEKSVTPAVFNTRKVTIGREAVVAPSAMVRDNVKGGERV